MADSSTDDKTTLFWRNLGGKFKFPENFIPCNPFAFRPDTTDYSVSSVENGTDVLTIQPRSIAGDVDDIKTLEDSLRHFELDHYLEVLEVSLEDVRRRGNNQEAIEAHNKIMQELDKKMRKLSKEHHPDKIQSRNGSEEDVLRAQKLQTAINVTRKAVNILNKIFLEDIDIDHKYGFYTKLDIGSLGNEDEIEGHVFEVLFKISLISEIKQCHIIAEIRKFLVESQMCIESYVLYEGNVPDFDKYKSSAFFHLRQCIRGYNKLLRELEEIKEESKAEKLDNIQALIRKMIHNYSEQLKHLQALLTKADLCSEGYFVIFTCPEYMDDYFVYPFVSYVNIILMCDVFNKRDKKKSNKIKIKKKNDPVFNEQTYFLFPAYYLTSYYGGSKRHEGVVRNLLKTEHIDKYLVKKKFLDILSERKDKLKDEFKTDKYSASCSNSHIAEELKKCMKMKSEFESTKKDLARDIEDVKKDNRGMSQQIDMITREQEECRRQIEAYFTRNAEPQDGFASTSEDVEAVNQEPQKKMSEEERGKQCEEYLAINSDLLARFASSSGNAVFGNQQMEKIMSEEERRKQLEACLARNSELLARFASTSENGQRVNQEPYKTVSEQEEASKQYEACLAKHSELQTKLVSSSEDVEFENQQMEKIMNEQDHRKQDEACLARNSDLLARCALKLGNVEFGSQQVKEVMGEQEDRRKQGEAGLVRNSELLGRFASTSENVEMVNQEPYKTVSEQEEASKQYKACLAKHSELENQQMKNILNEQDHRKQYEACLARNSDLLARFELKLENAEFGNQQMEKITIEEERRKQLEACLARNSDLLARFASTSETVHMVNQEPYHRQ